MLDEVREWVAREVAATFDLDPAEVAAVADAAVTPRSDGESPLSVAYGAATLVATCRVVRHLPGARGIMAERCEPTSLRDGRVVSELWTRLNERYAVPAPDAFDMNWPEHKVERVVAVPDGAVPGDEFMLGDGIGYRTTFQVHPGESGLVAVTREWHGEALRAWDRQAVDEVEAILRHAHGEAWLRRHAHDDDPGPVRRAVPADVPAILGLVRELALYERSPESVVATEFGLRWALFGPSPTVHSLVAEVDGEVVGFALWFLNFSTWLGRHGLYLEDLFVRPSHRGRGLGKALLETLVGIARERGYGRVEWVVLDWNSPAHDFYRSLGAEPMDDWTVWRLVP